MTALVYVVDQSLGVVVAYKLFSNPTVREVAATLSAFRLEYLSERYNVQAVEAVTPEGAKRAAFTGKRVLETADRSPVQKEARDAPPRVLPPAPEYESVPAKTLGALVVWAKGRGLWPPADRTALLQLVREFEAARLRGEG